MQRKSWVILAACAGLVGVLLLSYFASQSGNEPLTQTEATQMLDTMEKAMADKDINGIMQYIAPGSETRIANVSPDQARSMLLQFFHSVNSIHAEYSNVAFTGGSDDANLQFDLVVHSDGLNYGEGSPPARITLHLRRLDMPRLGGLYSVKEWRIVEADTTGRKLSDYGDM